MGNPRKVPRWVSQAQMAGLLSVSRWTIARARKAGTLRFVEVLPGLVRFDASQVEEMAVKFIPYR